MPVPRSRCCKFRESTLSGSTSTFPTRTSPTSNPARSCDVQHVVARRPAVLRTHPNGERRADVRNALVLGAHAAAESRRRSARRNAHQRDVAETAAKRRDRRSAQCGGANRDRQHRLRRQRHNGSGRSGKSRRPNRHARPGDQPESSARNEGRSRRVPTRSKTAASSPSTARRHPARARAGNTHDGARHAICFARRGRRVCGGFFRAPASAQGHPQGSTDHHADAGTDADHKAERRCRTRVRLAGARRRAHDAAAKAFRPSMSLAQAVKIAVALSPVFAASKRRSGPPFTPSTRPRSRRCFRRVSGAGQIGNQYTNSSVIERPQRRGSPLPERRAAIRSRATAPPRPNRSRLRSSS